MPSRPSLPAATVALSAAMAIAAMVINDASVPRKGVVYAAERGINHSLNLALAMAVEKAGFTGRIDVQNPLRDAAHLVDVGGHECCIFLERVQHIGRLGIEP